MVFGERKEGNIKLQLEMFYAHRDPAARPSSLLTHPFPAMRDCGGGTRPQPLHAFRVLSSAARLLLAAPTPNSVGGGPTPPLALGESQATSRSRDSLTRHW